MPNDEPYYFRIDVSIWQGDREPTSRGQHGSQQGLTGLEHSLQVLAKAAVRDCLVAHHTDRKIKP